MSMYLVQPGLQNPVCKPEPTILKPECAPRTPLRVSDPAGPGRGLIICIFKFLGEADAPGPRTPLREPQPWANVLWVLPSSET